MTTTRTGMGTRTGVASTAWWRRMLALLAVVALGLAAAACADVADQATDPERGDTGGGAGGTSTGTAATTGDLNEPALALISDQVLSEAPARPPAVDDGATGYADDITAARQTSVEPNAIGVNAGQTALGAEEAVLCATAELAFHELVDGAAVPGPSLLAGLAVDDGVVMDRRLAELLGRDSAGLTLDRARLDRVLDRCQLLGFER